MTNTQQTEKLSGDVSVAVEQKKGILPAKWERYTIGLLTFILLVGSVLGVAYVLRDRSESQGVEAYTLVPDKVSQSAAIAVALPEDISFSDFDPSKSVHFAPEIKGTWETAPLVDSRIYRFLPEEKLPVGMYYLAKLETPELTLEKMFAIDKDPSVLAIFPKQETEVSEYGNITIMFSRPMVALSTLSQNADISIPVSITPATPGRFKWITTRTLQFIPEGRLSRSSNYQVRVSEGFRSLDGVAVPTFVHSFTTRSLQYAYGTSDGVALHLTHAEPIRVSFNQPLDLEKTRALVTLTSSSSIAIPFTVSYGSRSVTDPKTGKEKVLTDQSILEVYPEKDSHGRSYLWDFGTSYRVSLSGAVPLEGDVTLLSPFSRSVQIEEIISQVRAESPRSNLVSQKVFDPQGTLVFEMSEPIELTRSSISGKGIAKIAYGEKCREPGVGEEFVVDESSCTKVPNQKEIIVSFDPSQFALGESSSVTFKKLVNTDGVTLNSEEIAHSFTTYKKFEILSTTPGDNSVKGSLTELTICSSNPLAQPLEEDFYKKFTSNMMIGKWDWRGSYLVEKGDTYNKNICAPGTFLTTVLYGLVPKFSYQFTLSLDDHFGQHIDKTLRFTTKDADPLAKGLVHMQSAVLMTPSDRTLLTYGLDFMDAVDVTVCTVSAETMLRYSVFPPSIVQSAEELSCVNRSTKHIVLPESPATRKYLQIDLKNYVTEKTGNYVVVISNPDYRRVTYQWKANERIPVFGELVYEKTFVTVTNLAVASKQVERTDYNWGYGGDNTIPSTFMNGKWPTNFYWVNDFRSLLPSQGAIVTPYARVGKVLVAQGRKMTGADGIAETESADNIIGAIVAVGADSAIVSNTTDSFSYAGQAGASRREYIYTDRPIYRPGDTVHIKGISRIGYDASYEADSGVTTVEIRDAKYESARKEEVKFSKNGTYEMTFVLDPNASLGYYQIGTNGGGYASFQVEEYVAPQFKVAVTSDKEEYISADTATLNISADYYFGVPVASGDAEYRIVSQEYYFDRYQDAYFSFGGGWYQNENGWYGDRFITAGKLKLGSGGKVSLPQELNIDKLFSGDYQKQSKVITVYVTVKNENGQSVSAQHSFIVHRGSFYVGVVTDDYFYVTGKTGAIKVKTVDVKGLPTAKSDLTVTLSRIEWKSYKRQEVDGNFYYRTEKTLTKVSESKHSTDKDGNASVPFTAGETGEYEVSISGTDKEGNKVSAQYQFYVSGKGSISVRPTNNASLELVSTKTDLSVGDTGSFIIKSPYAHAKALVTLVRGNIYERKVLDITSPITRYEFTVTSEEIPNFNAQVLLLSSDPEVKYGELYFRVNAKEKELTIKTVPNKKAYLPGEEVVLDILAIDSKGKPVKAELSLAVVDMSVLALVGNQKKDPVSFFYGGEQLTIRTAANVKNILNVAEIPVGTKGGSGGGGDELDKKKRGEFRDTAYWRGAVETDANGKATVRFTLPDNLTEWQVESVGVTSDTKIGAGYTEFTSRKTIMAVPLKPRFILPGDTFAVGGTIFNESDVAQKLTVSASSPTISFTGTKEVAVTIEPHTSLTVSFPALAPESQISGSHSFTIVAKNGEFEDTVTNSFPIKENNTYEFVATGGRITDANWKEEVYLPGNIVPDRGGLTISLGATMATMIDSAVSGILIYPYECTEQVASKLRTIAIIKQNEALFGTTSSVLPKVVEIGEERFTISEIVERGLAKIYQNEGEDGGVSLYPNMQASYWVTLSTLQTYIDLEQAGYRVDAQKMTKAAEYVFNYVNYPRENFRPTVEDVIQSYDVLSRLNNPRFASADVRTALLAYANNKDLVSRGLSTPALSALARISVKEKFGAGVTNRLFAEFENRSHIDARGTTVNSGVESPSSYVENSVQNTALALKAFSEAQRESPLLEGYLRAIKSAKSRDGGWSSTYNSITVIDAMTQYLKWTNEANAHERVSVTLGETPLFSAEFSESNIRTSYATEVPMSMLPSGVSHAINFIKKDLGKQKDAYYFDMLLKYHLPAASVAPRDEGFSVTRAFYRLDDIDSKEPVTSATQGEVLRGRVIVSTPIRRAHVSIEDYVPAGVEIVNQRFATEDQTLKGTSGSEYQTFGSANSGGSGTWVSRTLAQVFSFGGKSVGPKKDTDGMLEDAMYGNKSTTLTTLYPSAVENHDDRIYAYVENLPEGEYVYEYFVRALVPGVYQHLPLVVSELYTPENFGRTKGELFTVLKK